VSDQVVYKAIYGEGCGRCGATHEGVIALHGCPYDEDIHGDYEEKCTCCSKCMQECAYDI
jgi:hypothetical protein